jgi:hypothetical protein
MKTRNGFVSNSSSSSFVLVAEKDQWEECLKESHPMLRHLISNGSVNKVFGKELVTISGYESTEDSAWRLEDWNGEYVKSDGTTIPNDKIDDCYEVYDHDVVCMEDDAITIVCKKMKEKGYDFIHDGECC